MAPQSTEQQDNSIGTNNNNQNNNSNTTSIGNQNNVPQVNDENNDSSAPREPPPGLFQGFRVRQTARKSTAGFPAPRFIIPPEDLGEVNNLVITSPGAQPSASTIRPIRQYARKSTGTPVYIPTRAQHVSGPFYGTARKSTGPFARYPSTGSSSTLCTSCSRRQASKMCRKNPRDEIPASENSSNGSPTDSSDDSSPKILKKPKRRVVHDEYNGIDDINHNDQDDTEDDNDENHNEEYLVN